MLGLRERARLAVRRMQRDVEQLINQARSACARLENLQMLGDGTGLIAQVTDSATSLTTTVIGASGGTQIANFDVLLPGTVWDVLTRSSGNDPGQGKRRKIVSVNEATNVITVLAASSTEVQQFLDGSPPYPPTEPRDRMRLRADIAQRIQRNIDRLQISTTFWWRRLLRGLAVAICWTLGLTLLKDAVAAVVFAIVGGFVATVARDLVAIVEKSRR